MKPIVSRLSDLDGLKIGSEIIFKPLGEKYGVHRTYEARGVPNTRYARANGYTEAVVVSSAPPRNCAEEERTSRPESSSLSIGLLVNKGDALSNIQSTVMATCRESEERKHIEEFIARTLTVEEVKT
jgi:hypothetical protein